MEVSQTRKKRRSIIKALFGTSLAMFLAPIGVAIAKFLSFEGTPGAALTAKLSAADLTPDSPSELVAINGEPIVVVREPDNTIRAFTATCTHLGCTVAYRAVLPGTEAHPKSGFYCKCHQGEYDANGVNIPGTRPPSPLTELTITQVADDLTVSLIPKHKA